MRCRARRAARFSSGDCAIPTGRTRGGGFDAQHPRKVDTGFRIRMMRNQEGLPFRAEHIGSLLRPEELLEARRHFARGEINQAALTAAEDRAIEDAVRLQERIGLRLATDGEFRRASYHSYFYRQLGDIAFESPVENSAGGRGAQPAALIKSRIMWKSPIHAADFAFLRARTKALPKITIPGPCALHFRGGDAAVTAHAYRD